MASTLGALFAVGVDIGMAIAPVTGYVLQYRLILKNQSVGAFSIDICLVLLFANILRVNFYLFEQYKIALLFQSLIMVTAQIMLLQVCTEFKDDPPQEDDDDEDEDFWRWSHFSTYGRPNLTQSSTLSASPSRPSPFPPWPSWWDSPSTATQSGSFHCSQR